MTEQHNDLPVPPSWISLDSRQWQAAELDSTGMKGPQIALAVGVRRETIWRWQKLPEYIRARQELRRELHQRLSDRFWRLQDHAFDVAEESLNEGDPQMAIDIMRLGAPGIRDIVEIQGPTNDDAGTTSTRPIGPIPSQPLDAPAVAFECPTCSKAMKSARGLSQHTRRMHPPTDT